MVVGVKSKINKKQNPHMWWLLITYLLEIERERMLLLHVISMKKVISWIKILSTRKPCKYEKKTVVEGLQNEQNFIITLNDTYLESDIYNICFALVVSICRKNVWEFSQNDLK